MEKYVHGQPNIYALFMAKSVELLEEKGAFIFITPRSWTSGNYFSVIRAFLSDNLSFEKIHIFKDRDKSFSGETVLQETMILFATKQKSQTDNIEISISRDDLFDDVDIFAVKAVNIKNAGKERYLFIPSNTEEAKLIGEMNALTDTFSSLGYEFKTGPVVEFRNREMISSSKKPDFVPMYRSLNIT
ncbi:MAG: Eco57I restriction-modification methylase domain-containing protein, partial [Lachnospiraceae bacterium]|nr:Eco57I restriction-modification methylase domain-containing protein [Lachnospiraceae bacterium]